MKKTFLLLLLSLIINSLNAQKILRSTWTEVYNQFKVDPDVYNMTTGGSGGSYIIHLTYKNREKYSFTFSQVNNKLYGMTLICIDDNTTILRFNAEKEKRKAKVTTNGNYLYNDEKGRGVYLWLTEDDLGRKVINWEAKLPWVFD